MRNGIGLMLLLAAASCGDSAPPAPVAPTGPTPLPSPIMMSTRCFGPFHPGETAAAACFVDVGGGATPPVRAFADLRAFGGRADSALVQCPACGPPPWEFDLDVRIPADMPLGPQAIPVWMTDADGRRADTTALIQVDAR